MNTLLNLLAVAGGAAAAWHLVRAAFGFLRGGATGVWQEEMRRTQARRGDLTAMQESEGATARERERSRRAGLATLGWLVLLAAPSLTPWGRELYALYTVFWLAPAWRSVR